MLKVQTETSLLADGRLKSGPGGEVRNQLHVQAHQQFRIKGGNDEKLGTENNDTFINHLPNPDIDRHGLCGKKFSIEDIPEIPNKEAITVALEAGGERGYADTVHKTIRGKNRNKVNTEVMLFAVMYGKENHRACRSDRAYDLVIVESSWTNEWAPYLFS